LSLEGQHFISYLKPLLKIDSQPPPTLRLERQSFSLLMRN